MAWWDHVIRNPESGDVSVHVSKTDVGLLVSRGAEDYLIPFGVEYNSFVANHISPLPAMQKAFDAGNVIEVKIPSFVAKRMGLI